MSFEIACGLAILAPFAVLIVGGIIYAILSEYFKTPAQRMRELNERRHRR